MVNTYVSLQRTTPNGIMILNLHIFPWISIGYAAGIVINPTNGYLVISMIIIDYEMELLFTDANGVLLSSQPVFSNY